MSTNKAKLPAGFIVIITLLFFLLTACVDAEADLIINKDGSGKLTLIVTATDVWFNEAIDDLIADTRLTGPTVSISEGYNNNLKYAEFEIAFHDVTELAQHSLYVAHQIDNQKHRVELQSNEFLLRRITLQMPGKITASNGNHSGNKVSWDTFGTEGLMWAESEESLAVNPLIVIVAVSLTITLILIVWFVSSRRRSVNNRPINYRGNNDNGSCRKCGYPFSSSVEARARFCSNCGHPIQSNAYSARDDDIDIVLF